MKIPRHILVRVLMVLYICAVAYLCFGSFDSIPDMNKGLLKFLTDKVVHFCMFLPFPVLAALCRKNLPPSASKAAISIVLIFLLGCAFAASTELIQGRLTYRSCDIRDFGADALALLLGSVAVGISVAIRLSREPSRDTLA